MPAGLNPLFLPWLPYNSPTSPLSTSKSNNASINKNDNDAHDPVNHEQEWTIKGCSPPHIKSKNELSEGVFEHHRILRAGMNYQRLCLTTTAYQEQKWTIKGCVWPPPHTKNKNELSKGVFDHHRISRAKINYQRVFLTTTAC